MQDRFDREINYLRISVTNKCNLKCFYCSQSENLIGFDKLLTFDEIETIAKEAALIGFNKIRFTGGEPLLRKNIENIVDKVSNINGINQICLTTNATLLEQKASCLKKAGLTNLNISLDTLIPEKYYKITGGGDITRALLGIEEALKHNFKLKINMVVLKNINEDEIANMQKLCCERNIELQLIEQFSLKETKESVCKYNRPPNCEKCNRIRLLSNGILKSCLHSEVEHKINFSNIQKSFETVIMQKPQKGTVNSLNKMVEVGG